MTLLTTYERAFSLFLHRALRIADRKEMYKRGVFGISPRAEIKQTFAGVMSPKVVESGGTGVLSGQSLRRGLFQYENLVSIENVFTERGGTSFGKVKIRAAAALFHIFFGLN